MIRTAFVIPGDLALPTGGYAYDRRVLALLGRHGIDATHVALPGTFPAPSKDDLAETNRIIAAVPDDTVLLIDGLAYGALPGDVIAAFQHKIVALVHHPLCLEAGLAPMRARYLQQTEQMALALAEHVVVTSPTTARTLAADFAVPVAKMTVAVPGTDAAPRATGTGAPLELLAVGSLVPRKGYDVLASALRYIPAGIDWHLSIVGAVRDDAVRSALDDALAQRGADGDTLEKRVTITGGVDDNQLAELYHRADMFVMSSHYEGFGMVLTEALARGLPMVTTTGGAAAETVPDRAAIKVLPGDAGALGQALASALSDASLRKSLSDASWSAGQALARWDDTARAVAEALKRVRA
jgi:glycosyltransferase involved in cell wall biosynthesis